MSSRSIGVVILSVLVAASFCGCTKPPEPPASPAAPEFTAPIPEPAPGDSEPTPAPVTAEDAPPNRAAFEKWLVATSPHAARTDDERAVITELKRWLTEDADFENLLLLPAPDYDRKDFPREYYKWYGEGEMTVQLFRERGPESMVVTVGPPEACAWCTVTLLREDGKWIVSKAIDDSGPEETLFYERGKGFIEQEDD